MLSFTSLHSFLYYNRLQITPSPVPTLAPTPAVAVVREAPKPAAPIDCKTATALPIK